MVVVSKNVGLSDVYGFIDPDSLIKAISLMTLNHTSPIVLDRGRKYI